MIRPFVALFALIPGLVAVRLPSALADEPGQEGKAAPGGTGAPAVVRGRVTDEAGAPLVDVRVLVAIPAVDMRFVDPTTKHTLAEARTDARGDYRMELPGLAGRTTISLDAMKPSYQRLVGTLRSGGDARRILVGPGESASADLKLKPALHFAGTVVDERGKGIGGVQISANVNTSRSSGGIERTASRPDGSFDLFNYPEAPIAFRGETTKGVVYFFHPDYIDQTVEDIYALTRDRRESIRVVLPTGYRLAGVVVDEAGKPVPGAMVRVIRKDETHRKATLTDAGGKFAFRGLSEGLTMLSARALPIKEKANQPMSVKADRDDLEVRLRPMELPADLKGVSVLGMQLADVTPELKSAYDLHHERGAVVLDPGENADRLAIGKISEGDCFWLVGEIGQKRVGSVREFVTHVLAEAKGGAAPLVRVVFEFSRVEFDGNSTQYMKLTKDDLKQLQALLDQMDGDGF